MHLRIFLLIVFLFVVKFCCSETAVKKLKFDVIGLSEGLSQGMINSMLQDQFGFMWFATKDGLNRYDGHRFIVYRNDPSDSGSIADNFIECLFEDSKGRLWIGTASKGLDLFDRETETFRHFRKELSSNSLCSNQITGITEDGHGNIWISTIECISLLRITDQTGTESESYNFQTIDSIKGNVFVLKNGDIYLSGKNSFKKIDDNSLRKKDAYANIDGCPGSSVGLVVEDTLNGWRYFITQSCVVKTNGLSKKIFNYSPDGFHAGLFLGQGWIDDNGMMWLCNLDWLMQMDTESGNLIRVLADDINLNRMLSSVNYVYRDNSGIVWVGTKGFGILKYNPRSEKFHHTDIESIYLMSPMRNGSVLIGKPNERTVREFNPESGGYGKFIPPSSIALNQNYPTFGSIEGVVEDDSGKYWIGLQQLICYDEQKKSLEYYSTGNFSFPIFKDIKGQIWCGTDRAFGFIDQVKKSFVSYPYPITPSNVPYKFLQVIYEDHSGVFWLGTTHGLLRFNPADESWKQYRNIPGDSASLSFDLIFSICPDPSLPEQFLWIGTNGGLNLFDMKTGKSRRYFEKDGLPNNAIYGILSDQEGNLWMSTNKGVSRLNPSNGVFRNFDQRDGLQSNEFSRYAYCKSEQGIIFFGGVNGFNYFNPLDLRDNPFVPHVYITEIKINNISVQFKSKNSPLKKPVYLTDEVVLNYSDNMVSFGFASFDFTAPDKNLYKYKLEGFDEDWIQSGTQYTATYTNLNPGEYQLIVLGSNNDNIWNETGASLKLIILPPWYMTWWFRLGVLLIISVLVYLIYSYRMNQKLKMLNIRNRIASDLHDEIGSTLSSVSVFSEIVRMRTTEKLPEINPMMGRIIDNIYNMMEAMNDIVWTINAGNDRFENIINRMRANAAELFEAKGINLHIDFYEALSDRKLGMLVRKNLYLIFKESINNVAKYSMAKNVWIRLYLKNKFLRMEIEDDGRGFDINIKPEGNGIPSMKRRAHELGGILNVQSSPGNGTIILLEFPITKIND